MLIEKSSGVNVSDAVELIKMAQIVQGSLKLISGLFDNIVSKQNELAQKAFMVLDEAIHKDISGLPEPMKTIVMDDTSVRNKYVAMILKQNGISI